MSCIRGSCSLSGCTTTAAAGAEARNACGNSRQRATSHAALAVVDQTVEAMSLYRLGQTDEARQALAAADWLLDDRSAELPEPAKTSIKL